MGQETPSSAMLSVVGNSTLAVLGTNGPNGPHLAPVWFLFRNGQFLITTGVRRQKARNIQLDRRVGLTIMADGGSPAVMLDGTATLDHIEVMGLMQDTAYHYLGATQGALYIKGIKKKFTSETLWRITITPTWWKSWALDEA